MGMTMRRGFLLRNMGLGHTKVSILIIRCGSRSALSNRFESLAHTVHHLFWPTGYMISRIRMGGHILKRNRACVRVHLASQALRYSKE